jgi:hypothetical protein
VNPSTLALVRVREVLDEIRVVRLAARLVPFEPDSVSIRDAEDVQLTVSYPRERLLHPELLVVLGDRLQVRLKCTPVDRPLELLQFRPLQPLEKEVNLWDLILLTSVVDVLNELAWECLQLGVQREVRPR